MNPSSLSPCSSDLAELQLFVKAGVDGVRLGACPLCQRATMALLLKAESAGFKFRVVAVNVAKPPSEFRRLGLKTVPALAHGERTCDTIDDIVQFLDDNFPSPDLRYDDAAADDAVKNFFSKFCFFIRQVSKDSTQLLNELSKVDAHLLRRQERGRFLCADSLSHLDCEVLPKLQHVRVACLYLKRLSLPTELAALWRYLYAAYECASFVQSCPPDQEIVLHWADKPGIRKLAADEYSSLVKHPPTYSLDVAVFARQICVVDDQDDDNGNNVSCSPD